MIKLITNDKLQLDPCNEVPKNEWAKLDKWDKSLAYDETLENDSMDKNTMSPIIKNLSETGINQMNLLINKEFTTQEIL